MPRLSWTPPAVADLVRLHKFLHLKNPEAALRAVQTIYEGVQLLRNHPHLGRPVTEFPGEQREWVIQFGQGAYMILYRFDGKIVWILRLRHAREAGY